MSDLAARSVREFLASVASIDDAVPAGGSVAALTGASSAALLALVCGVLDRKGVAGVSEFLPRARHLQDRLLELVDEDAAAFREYLHARRTHQDVETALTRTTRAPLEIATACGEVVNLSREVEGRTEGPMRGDVRSAGYLANAALTAALDLAEQDVALVADPAEQARLRDEIAASRSRARSD